jgi:hypothetical protein
MTSTSDAQGPGGQEFFSADGQVWMVYHGWLPGQVNTPGGERRLYLDDITVTNDVPERIGAQRIGAQLFWLAAGFIVVVGAAVTVVVIVRRRRRRALRRADVTASEAD